MTWRQILSWEVEPERVVNPVRVNAYCTLTTAGVHLIEAEDDFGDRFEDWVVVSVDPNPYFRAEQGVFTIMPEAIVDSGTEEEKTERLLSLKLDEWDQYIELTGALYVP